MEIFAPTNRQQISPWDGLALALNQTSEKIKLLCREAQRNVVTCNKPCFQINNNPLTRYIFRHFIFSNRV